MKTPTHRMLLVWAALFAVPLLSAQTPDARKAEARTSLNAGVAAFKNGNTREAVDSMTRALQLDPEFIQAELYLASTYASIHTSGQPGSRDQEAGRKAIESFERVLQKQPESVDAVAGLAAMYVSTNEPAKARDLYLRLSKMSLQNPTAFYAVGALDWALASRKTNPLPEPERMRLLDEGLQSIDIALTLNPQFDDAMVYKNLLLRQKAENTQDPAERTRLTEEADRLFSRSLELRRQKEQLGQTSTSPFGLAAPPPPPPPPPPPLPQGLIRVGGTAVQANLVNQVKPVYPAAARAARIQGVVLLQAVIDTSGRVADVQVVSGHPLLNEAAVDAVRQWRYQPVLLNGQAVDVVTTVTVNFVFQ